MLTRFNEPDLGSQANLSPAAAAAAWKQYMEPFHGKAKLVSPAVTNGAPPAMGTGWLDSFLAACTGCHIDAIAIHIYDSATNTAYFQNYISGVASKYGKPVWVTEVRSFHCFECYRQVCSFVISILCAVRRERFRPATTILLEHHAPLLGRLVRC